MKMEIEVEDNLVELLRGLGFDVVECLEKLEHVCKDLWSIVLKDVVK